MDVGKLTPWLRSNWWLIALVVVIALGYSLGKDRAQRDNHRDSTRLSTVN